METVVRPLLRYQQYGARYPRAEVRQYREDRQGAWRSCEGVVRI